ncbi:MAG: zinc ABC transporter substrate-binding protein [Planctomycetota bacterium]
MHRFPIAIAAAFLALVAFAAPAQQLRVVATTGMIADVVTNVAGDRAEVVQLMRPGIDPHLYKPTRSDIRRLMDADIIFYNGLLLEGKMTDALIRAATAGKAVHAVTELIEDDRLLEPDEFEGLADPHLWMDPTLWAETVSVVQEKLGDADPDNASTYAENAQAYKDQLFRLDAYAERVLGTVPEASRVLVTAHDAFNYFGSRYGFELVGIQGVSTESEAGVRDIARIAQLLVDRKVSAVFVESTVSARSVQAVIAGARAKGHDVSLGGELFSDAMGEAGTYEGTYIGMIDHNVTTIARSLGGEAPEAGMSGALSNQAND